MSKLTQDFLVNLLATNNKAICRAVVVLNNRQTTDEQTSETTRHNNGRGFQPAHAKMGTSHANFYTRAGFLTPKQIAYWRKLNAKGQMRIARYWRQLQEEAMAKTNAVQVMASKPIANYVHVTSPRVFEAFSPTGAE